MGTQKSLIVVIDEFEASIAALALDAPQPVRDRLHRATGDLLELLASTATLMAVHEVVILMETLAEQAKEIAALDARTERRSTPREDAS